MPTIDDSGADAVRLVSNERMDIPDFDAGTYGLNSEQLTRVLGMLVGSVLGTTQPFSGCASRPTTSYDSGTKFLTINGCLFYQGGSAAAPSTAPAGRLIAYDPTQPWQSAVTGVDLNSFSPSTACIVWALPSTTQQSNLETRKRWLPGASAETSFSTNTRLRTIIESFQALAVGVSPPSSSWFPIMKIATWTAGSPNITEISMWDGTPNLSLVGVTATQMMSGNPAPNVGYLLYMIRKGLAYILDNVGGDNWTEAATNPYRGLKQLDTDLTTAEADINTLQGEMTYITALAESATSLLVASTFSVYKTGGSWAILIPGSSSSANLSGWSYDGTGAFSFTISSTVMAPAGYVDAIYAVNVTLNNNGGTAPTATPTPTVRITSSSTGTFEIKFWSGGSLTDPDDDGFAVIVTGRRYS